MFFFLGMVFYKLFFYLFGRRAVVALCWIWGLFFNWKKMCPFVRLDFFFYYQIRKLLQFRKLSLHLIFSYVSSKVQVFWEWHKIWKKNPHKVNVKFMWEIFSNFVALSEYIAFKGGGEKIRPLNFTEGI